MILDKINSPAEVMHMGVTLIIGAAVAFIVALIVFCFAKKASKALGENPNDTTPHTIMLVIGVFGDVFYFLGGLFALLNVGEYNNQVAAQNSAPAPSSQPSKSKTAIKKPASKSTSAKSTKKSK